MDIADTMNLTWILTAPSAVKNFSSVPNAVRVISAINVMDSYPAKKLTGGKIKKKAQI